MNAQQRIELLKSLIHSGTSLKSNSTTEPRTVTRVTPYNCYVNNVRYSWPSLEKCFRPGPGSFSFDDHVKQSQLIFNN